MKLTININISDKTIADVLDGAASRYWCAGLDCPPYVAATSVSCWQALLDGSIPYVQVEEDRSEERRRNSFHRVTRTRIAIAFDIMAREYPHVLGEACGSDGLDSNTGDVLLQLAALGELKYG